MSPAERGCPSRTARGASRARLLTFGLGLGFALAAWAPSSAWGQGAPGAAPAPETSKQERRRRALQEKLGIEGTGRSDAGTPPAVAKEEPAAVPGAGSAPAHSPSPSAGTSPAPKTPPPPTYVADAAPVLEQACAGCHRVGGSAGSSGWVLGSGPAADHALTLRFVQTGAPAKSPLLRKASGAAVHAPGRVLATGTPGYATLLRWIEGGALLGRVGKAASPAPLAGATPVPLPRAGLPVPAVPVPSLPPGGEAASSAAEASSPMAAPASAAALGPAFVPELHEALLTACGACHGEGRMAGATRYRTSPEAAVHFEAARALVEPGEPERSLLLLRARGESHSAGAVWKPGSASLGRLAEWISAGAALDAAPAPAATAAVGESAAPPLSTGASQAGAARPPASMPPERGGVSLVDHPLLGSLRLHGRFDLNFERVGYSDHPFQKEGNNALRSYHQLLFLTRQSLADPVTLTVELLGLQFWELGLKLSPQAWPLRVSAKLGKILVPFGADPLFHQSYGGHAGFDQRVLPVVFAREGASANVQGRWRGLSLSGDLYFIAGYGLRRPEALLSLQSDFAPLEEARPGFGARLGASYGPLSLWYSPYFNTLDFGRKLFMQGLDLSVWRPRGVPVLEHFSFGAGLLRADVSGGEAQGYGGPGEDYYHFASYTQLRYYPQDWLYVQYRQGLRTFGNRRGVVLDDSDLTREDAGTHNVGAVARWRGLSAGLFHYWNLEKADEVPDDFTRLVVAFEF